VNDEFLRTWKRSWSTLRHFLTIFLERGKSRECQDNRQPDGDMNPGPIKYEAEMLTTRSRNLYQLRCLLTHYRYRMHHVEKAQHLSAGTDSIDLFNRYSVGVKGNQLSQYLVTFIP
jgi:hypothetical protein